jgi:hypothetical protein
MAVKRAAVVTYTSALRFRPEIFNSTMSLCGHSRVRGPLTTFKTDSCPVMDAMRGVGTAPSFHPGAVHLSLGVVLAEACGIHCSSRTWE